MDFINKHITKYGYDRKVIFIKDKLFRLVEDKVISLGYEHVMNNKDILLSEVESNLTPSYVLIDDTIFILCEKIQNKQKARERIFELLCSFRIFLEHLGRFAIEYSSIDDDVFYLFGNLDKPYNLISSKIENGIITTTIHKDLLEYVCNFYLHSSLRKEKAGLIIFDEKQSTVQKVKKQLLEENVFYVSDRESLDEIKEDIKSENIPYFLIISHSLAKRNEVKLVSFVEDFEKNISVNDLSKSLKLYDSKVDKLLFNKTLSMHINESFTRKDLCKICAKHYEKDNIIIKDFTQKLNLRSCTCCNNYENVFTYTILSKSL